VENIPLQDEHHSARRSKLFAFPPESVFAFRPECCSESQRNAVRLQTGIAFAFDRIPQLDPEKLKTKSGRRRSSHFWTPAVAIRGQEYARGTPGFRRCDERAVLKFPDWQAD